MRHYTNDSNSVVDTLRTAKLDYRVTQEPVSVNGREVEGFYMNHRDDKPGEDGDITIVKSRYGVLQHDYFAEMLDELVETSNGKLACDRISELDNSTLCFHLKGQPFEAGGNPNDPVESYILGFNNHDGTLPAMLVDSTFRLMCRNQLPALRKGKRRVDIRLKHTGDMEHKLRDAIGTIRALMESRERQIERINTLSKRHMTMAEVEKFFADVYTRTVGPIPVNPEGKAQNRQYNKAVDAASAFNKRFEREADKLHSQSLWVALNAFTGTVQHDLTARDKTEKRNILGTGDEMTRDAYAYALSLVA